jgi:quercetin dioxygenase-like cupin family protein
MLNPLIKRRVTVKKIALLLLAGASLLSTNVAAREMNAPATKVSKVFDRELPNVPGKSMRAVLVEYGPGAASPSHRHPSSAFIYATVLEGEIRSKVNDEPEHVYKAGESWTEMPGDHHKVSANASSTKPARLLPRYDGERDCHPRQIARLPWQRSDNPLSSGISALQQQRKADAIVDVHRHASSGTNSARTAASGH